MGKKNGRSGRSGGNGRRRAGRKTKLTPALQKKLCEYVRKAVPVKNAAGALGITPQTVCSWQEKGERGEEPYAEFLEAITLAREECFAHLAKIVYDAAPKDWRAAIAILERRLPMAWAKSNRLELSGRDGGAIKIEEQHRDQAAQAMQDPSARKAMRDLSIAMLEFEKLNGEKAKRIH